MMHSLKLINVKLEKGFFPYDWFNDYDKLNDTELPSHEDYFIVK
jgi:hypothetical protein